MRIKPYLLVVCACLALLSSHTSSANSSLSRDKFSFELPPPPVANAGIDQNICGLTTNMAGNNPAPGVGLWTLISGPGTATFVNPAIRNTSVTVSTAGIYILQWTITNPSDGTFTNDQVQVTFSNPASSSNAGPDQTVCGNQATMAGNTPTSGFGSWFSVSGPGTISFSNPSSPSCLVTASVDGTYILQWNIFNGVCPVTSDQVSITFNNQAPAPNAGFDDVICGLTYNLNGNNPAPSTGLWTLNSGPGSATFTNASVYNTSVSVSVPGVYLFDWTITNPVCPPEAISVQITFNFYPETCNGIDDDCDSQIDEGVQTTYYVDADGDGFGDVAQFTQACTQPSGYVLSNTDCNDLNPAVYPGATEVCNLIDDDCDNQIDEGVQTTFYQDLDGDTYGNPNAATQGCTQPTGYVANNFDCNDTNPTIYAGAPETCNLLDDDCDNQIDEGVQNTYYADVDGDSFGNPNSTTLACNQPTGYVSNNTDCNDNNPAINPNTIWYLDADADGYYISTLTQCTSPGVGYNTTGGINGDCNDNNPAINAGANETCNLIDDNCNGQIDEGVQNTYYQDADGDTYGNSAATTLACTQPAGYVSNSTDCNDTNATIYPGATETCNGIDDDCDSQIDDGVLITYYVDADGDGFGDVAQFTQACTQPSGYVLSNTDCNDLNPAVYPGATEVCNLIDDDCDNQIDEGVQTTFYQDLDGDTYGNPNAATQGCTQPNGYVANNFDCNDTNPTIYAGAPETCNLLDDDCDNQIDEGVQNTYYADVDGDSFGNPNSTTLACNQPTGYVSNNTDCNDNNPAINPNTIWYLDADADGYYISTLTQCTSPGVGYNTTGGINGDCNDNNPAINAGANETCNLIDDNCNGQIDEGVQNTYYQDADGDTYGNSAATTLACTQPAGYVSNSTDCDDTNATIYPGATETCNGIDDDCDSQIDDGVLITYYVDADGDGFGDVAQFTQACTQPSGYVLSNTDCNDLNPAVYPGATEVCNLIDDDCDNQIDEGVQTTFYQDLDGDTYGNPNAATQGCTQPTGYVANNFDCNDTNPTIYAGAPETCNLLDDDCDNQIDEGVQNTYYADVDGDSFGNPNSTTLACNQPTGYVTDNTDCDDNNPAINPNTIWYADTDGDGFGNLNNTTPSCLQPAGYVSNSTDCDDTNATIYTGATETCNGIDDDCDSQIDDGVLITYYLDADGDSFGDVTQFTEACTPPSGYVLDNTDCDDLNSAIYPGATEVCNLLDDDCDNQIDEGTLITFYADIDSDGYGDPSAGQDACTQPNGYVLDNTDCDDTNALINPGSSEICNEIDDNCNNQIDEGVQTAYYADLDLDGFGDALNDTLTCTQPTEYVLDNTDCNDNDSAINPNTVWYLDADGDGYYVSTLTQCISPGVGYNTIGGTSGDCDDSNASVNAGAIESCNNVDDDCSGVIDDNLVYVMYYADADGDGFGDPLADTLSCISVSGYILDNTDCNDADAFINPNTVWYEDADADGYYVNTVIQCVSPGPSFNTTGGTSGDCDDNNFAINAGVSEICNEIDDNCNALVDEGVQTFYYFDADLDGFGDANVDTLACSAPAGYVASNADCDDNNVSINPNGIEICNGIDENCNNLIDEGVLTSYFADLDNDTFGDASNDSLACSLPVGYVTDNSDCNDNDAFYNPLTIWYLDADGDGFYIDSLIQCTQPSSAYTVAQGIFGDCNDFDSNINANATEICNFIDDNCNTFIDEGAEPIPFYADNDSDGFGDVFNDSLACFAPIGYVLDSYDCDDTNPSINPAMADICNNIDDNCNGFIDEGQNTGECADIDNDGLNAYYDQDDDNDGVLDINEELTALNNGDTDLDGVPDRWDLDSDNDGIYDILENLGNDPDGDGMYGAGPIVDGNFDGIDDSIGPNGISPLDTDLDGQPNFQDLDSDADTVPDAVEYDNNNDGVVLDDTDADGNYDFLDSDDDGDGLLTSIEWDYNLDGNSPDDCDYDGIPNYLDADACQLFIPEGFSPNGDGTNDTFVIENYPPGSTIKIQIFNRWGAEVFASDNYLNDWTGNDLPVGTYYYIIQFSTEEQGSAGYLTLWR